jgi:hypothetical protein
MGQNPESPRYIVLMDGAIHRSPPSPAPPRIFVRVGSWLRPLIPENSTPVQHAEKTLTSTRIEGSLGGEKSDDRADLEKAWRVRQAKAAADARHSQAGGSRDKREQIRKSWFSGKYKTRDQCADQEHGRLKMTYSTARKALRKTPNPKRI